MYIYIYVYIEKCASHRQQRGRAQETIIRLKYEAGMRVMSCAQTTRETGSAQEEPKKTRVVGCERNSPNPLPPPVPSLPLTVTQYPLRWHRAVDIAV